MAEPTNRHPRPSYIIKLGTRDLTPLFEPRLISLTLCESRGGEADQLDLVLDDSDGALEIPSRGAELSLWLGFEGRLVEKGTFHVDETEHTGAPDTLCIRARAADMRQALRSRVERSWHATTLGGIVTELAKKHHLVARIDTRLASRPVAHADQTESDISFLQRLASRYDAVVTVKRDALLCLPIKDTRTSKGEPLPTRLLTRDLGDRHRWHTADRDAYSGVRAYWHDPHRSRRRSVLVGKSGNAKRLREGFADERSARDAAQAEWQRIQRGAATLEITLALGQVDIAPQTPVLVRGFKPQIDAGEWLTVKATHSLSDGGLTTRLELENGAAADDAGGAAEDVDEGF